MATFTTVMCDMCRTRMELSEVREKVTLQMFRGPAVILLVDLCDGCSERVRRSLDQLSQDTNKTECSHRWVATRGAWERCELCGTQRAAGG